MRSVVDECRSNIPISFAMIRASASHDYHMLIIHHFIRMHEADVEIQWVASDRIGSSTR